MTNTLLHGFVDSVAEQHVTGWLSGSDQAAVLIMVNNTPQACALLTTPRPDVVATGLSSHSQVGFNLTLELRSGDIVRVTTLDQQFELQNSPAIYIGQGFLHLSLLVRPEYQRIAFLQHIADVQGFIPLQGMSGVNAAILDKTASKSLIKTCQSSAEQHLLETLLDKLLPNAGIAAPRFINKHFIKGHYSIEYSYFEGCSLDGHVENINLLQAVLADVHKIQTLPIDLESLSVAKKPFLLTLIKSVALAHVKRFRVADCVVFMRLLHFIVSLPRVFSHGDLHVKNVIHDQAGNFSIIDWDRVAYLPLGYDFACLLKGCSLKVIDELLSDLRLKKSVLIFIYMFKVYENKHFLGSQQAQVWLAAIGALEQS